MPAIRRKYHQGSVVLGAESHLSDTKALCGKSVPVLMKNGEFKNIEFGRFVEKLNHQKVKVIDIMQFTDCDLGWLNWQDLPSGSVVVGEYVNGVVNVTWPLIHYVPE